MIKYTKKEIRKDLGGENRELQTWYYESPIGTLEIRSTVSAVHAILFSFGGKTDPRGNSVGSTPLARCVLQLDEYFLGGRKTFDFPFDQTGTAFQQKVWNELLKIPYGSTISYLELSRRIGDHKAIRAVGTANGKNNMVIVVPCHRVIGSNGSLVGYGGELWRKKWLLDHEQKFQHGVQFLFSHDVKNNSHKG